MKLSSIMSHSKSSESRTIRKHTPWIASPLDSGAVQPHDSDIPKFKEHHESDAIQLFYDLFFVANLSTFTEIHDIVDKKSLSNYIGFFTILWCTWLQTSLFDVRFSADSVFNRVCKSISFCVMTGFAACGVLYDTTQISEHTKAFRIMSIILMVSRLALVIQYAVVLWYVKEYPKIFRPLVATMASLFIAAMVFLGTFFGFRVSSEDDSFPIQHGSPHTYIAWYVVVGAEVLAVISISCTWRYVSFKRANLVERLGLLTLIIMGEGIIGMTKSVSQILQNSNSVTSSDVGTVLSAVLLIYFIWVLYFDQIEKNRFGTISEQIWAILHYPLHVAILLTVEGSTTLVLWNTFIQVDTLWWDQYYSTMNTNYSSDSELIILIQQAINKLSREVKLDNQTQFYDYNQTLTSIGELNSQSPDWTNETIDLVTDIWVGMETTIFSNLGIDAPSRTPGHKENTTNVDNADYNTINTALTYFYASAGSFLIILAMMYCFGKKHKSNEEYVSIVVRAVAGIGITLTIIAIYLPIESSYNFVASPWLIPIVMLGYFVVIVLDNLLVWRLNKKLKKQTSNNESKTFSLTSSLIGVAI